MPNRKKPSKQRTGHHKKVDEPIVPYIPCTCPDNFDDTAKKYWLKMSPYLIKAKQLHPMTEDAFIELCDIYSQLQKINLALRETNFGLLQLDDKWDNKQGTETQCFKESALSDIKRKYSKQFLEYCRHFHLTPYSMKGVYDFGEEADPLERFLNKKNGKK